MIHETILYGIAGSVCAMLFYTVILPRVRKEEKK